MKKQKKLTITPRENSGRNDYESIFLPTPQSGRISLDEYLIPAHNLEFFNEDLLKKSRQKFKEKVLELFRISEVPENEFYRIEAAIGQYVKSSKLAKNRSQYIALVGAILDFNENLNYDQIKNKGINEKHKISIDAVEIYQKCAMEITAEYLVEFFKNHAPACEFGYDFTSILYRGIVTDNEFIREYDSNEEVEYMEKEVLNSYSLCMTISDEFAVKNENTRRTLILTSFSSLCDRVFSSFIVSDRFDYDFCQQFELLCLPSNFLTIKNIVSNGLIDTYVIR